MKLRQLLALLDDGGVRFAVIGGVALIARGIQRTTEDLDIAYARDRGNLARLAATDLLGEVPGLGTFDRVDAASSELEIDGRRVLVLTLDGLERAKRAAGRPKDLIDLGYIRALRDDG